MRDTLIKNEKDAVHEEVFQKRKNKCKRCGLLLLGMSTTIGIIFGSFYAGIYYERYLSDGSDLN